MFRDVVSAKVDGSKVILRDLLGDFKEFENYRIVEVDVNSARLILSTIEESQ